MRQIVSIITENKYPKAKAIRPYSGVNMTIVIINRIIEIILLKTMRLFFSFPNNLEVNILVKDIGIILKLIIFTTSIISIYSGKKVETIRGPKINPKIEISTETKIVTFFN